MNKQFLYSVLNLAENYCGEEFSQNLAKLRQERERILNNVWKKEPIPEDPSSYQKEILLRDIDYDTIIHHAAKVIDREKHTDLLYHVAQAAIDFGEFAKARETLYTVLKQVKRRNRELTASVLKNIGNVEIYTNNFQSAQKVFNRSLKIFTEIDQKEGIASVTNHIGAMLVEMGKFYSGEIHFIKARKMADELKLNEMSAKINMNLGNVYNMRGIYDDAINCYEKALDKSSSDDLMLLSNINLNLSITHKFLQNYDAALAFLDKSLAFAQQSNSKYQKALVYLTKAEIACARGELSKATALVTSAFMIFTEIGDRLSIADAYKILGMINRQQKTYDVAMSYFENSRRIYTNPFYLAETLVEMAKLYQDMGEKKMAKKTLKEAIANFNKVGADIKVKLIKKSFADLK